MPRTSSLDAAQSRGTERSGPSGLAIGQLVVLGCLLLAPCGVQLPPGCDPGGHAVCQGGEVGVYLAQLLAHLQQQQPCQRWQT